MFSFVIHGLMNGVPLPSVNSINLSNLKSYVLCDTSIIFSYGFLWIPTRLMALLSVLDLSILCLFTWAEFPSVFVVNHGIRDNIVISYVCSLVRHYWNECY